MSQVENKKRLQVIFSDEAWANVESVTNEANQGFETGSINYSDVVNEMVLAAKVDIRALQLKHTDLRRSLRVMAAKDSLDLDSIIKTLTELKAKTGKRSAKSSNLTEDSLNG